LTVHSTIIIVVYVHNLFARVSFCHSDCDEELFPLDVHHALPELKLFSLLVLLFDHQVQISWPWSQRLLLLFVELIKLLFIGCCCFPALLPTSSHFSLLLGLEWHVAGLVHGVAVVVVTGQHAAFLVVRGHLDVTGALGATAGAHPEKYIIIKVSEV
jgi:hypothetical protein